jgi:hypothetical protein
MKLFVPYKAKYKLFRKNTTHNCYFFVTKENDYQLSCVMFLKAGKLWEIYLDTTIYSEMVDDYGEYKNIEGASFKEIFDVIFKENIKVSIAY